MGAQFDKSASPKAKEKPLKKFTDLVGRGKFYPDWSIRFLPFINTHTHSDYIRIATRPKTCQIVKTTQS